MQYTATGPGLQYAATGPVLQYAATGPMQSNGALDKSQVTVSYSRATLVAVKIEKGENSVKRVICKTWTGTLAYSADPDRTPQNAASDHGMRCLIEL